MKPIFSSFQVGVICLAIVATSSSMLAQQGPGHARFEDRVAKQKQAATASRALLEAKDFEGAESLLEQASEFTRGTPESDFDVATALGRLAAEFHARRDTSTASAIARRVLARLGDSQRKLDKSTDPARLANLMEMAGCISERFLGDLVLAESYYDSAVKLSPDFGQAAEALARLTAMKIEAAKKAQGSTKS